jgi:ABC-2 type transport system ATP-binding protein
MTERPATDESSGAEDPNGHDPSRTTASREQPPVAATQGDDVSNTDADDGDRDAEVSLADEGAAPAAPTKQGPPRKPAQRKPAAARGTSTRSSAASRAAAARATVVQAAAEGDGALDEGAGASEAVEDAHAVDDSTRAEENEQAAAKAPAKRPAARTTTKRVPSSSTARSGSATTPRKRTAATKKPAAAKSTPSDETAPETVPTPVDTTASESTGTEKTSVTETVDTEGAAVKPRTPRKPPTTRRRTSPAATPRVTPVSTTEEPSESAAATEQVVAEVAATGTAENVPSDKPEPDAVEAEPATEAGAERTPSSEPDLEVEPEPKTRVEVEPEPAAESAPEAEVEPETAAPNPKDVPSTVEATPRGAPLAETTSAQNVARGGPSRARSWWNAARSAVQQRVDTSSSGSNAPAGTASRVPALRDPEPRPESRVESAPVALGEAPVVLSIQGLVKRYGATVAVENVDLEVRAGSFYGIVGPNGAGKTTTLSIATGLLRPDEGTVTILGTDVWSNAADSAKAKRSLGVLPDRLRLFDRLTGAQFLYYAATLRGLDGATARKRSADLADAFGLRDALGRLVSDYSVGMTKKVALAAAIIHSPRVLVLDEPFESVDPVSAATVTEILQRYVRGGGTVLLSSHSMDLVERICDSVAVIVDGHVLASGTVNDVRAGRSLQERFVELAGGGAQTEGMEWLHNFSD